MNGDRCCHCLGIKCVSEEGEKSPLGDGRVGTLVVRGRVGWEV